MCKHILYVYIYTYVHIYIGMCVSDIGLDTPEIL